MHTTQTNVIANEAILCPPPAVKATTANEAAALVFPKVAEHFNAFWEKEAEMTAAPSIEILDLIDEFWSLILGPLGTPEHPIVFVASENQFRRFNPAKGTYDPISESTVISGILADLELCAEFLPARVKYASFINCKNRQRIKSVVERAKDLLAVDDDFFQDKKHMHLPLANGVLQIDNAKFHPSEPGRAVKETLPIRYDPDAKCDLFLHTFLANILSLEDIDILQRYLSQVLEGINHSQIILILTGDAGWGKSSLMKILGTMIGWKNVGIIRENVF